MSPQGAPQDGSSSFRLLAGLRGSNPSDSIKGAALTHPGMVAAYRLRVIAAGALLMVMALPILLGFILLPGHAMTAEGFLLLVGVNLLAMAGLVLMPWDKVLLSPQAGPIFFGWSAFALVLVSLGIFLDGGGTSPLAALLFPLVLIYALANQRREQLVLFLLTVLAYAGVVGLRDWNISASDFYFRILTLAMVAVIAAAMSGWLISEMLDRARTRNTADQRAGMLDTVARAARRVSSLDASLVLGGALSGAMELGAFESEVWLFDKESQALQLQKRIAIEAGSPNEKVALELFELCRDTGATQIQPAGRDSLIGCLLHLEGGSAGILLVKTSEADSKDQLIVECMELLAAQVSAGLDVARNVAERRGLEERLAHWAFHDALTDLPNRVLFADRLELALARTQRDASKVAVLFLDLDGFKAINDSLGHSAGDELLVNVATRIHGCLRPNDTLARYGGDEFVVLVEQIDDAESALVVARRILESLGTPMEVGGKELTVRTSIGIALTTARPGADSDVMRRADIAMYEAKAAGGSQFVLSPSPDTEPTVLRQTGEAS